MTMPTLTVRCQVNNGGNTFNPIFNLPPPLPAIDLSHPSPPLMEKQCFFRTFYKMSSSDSAQPPHYHHHHHSYHQHYHYHQHQFSSGAPHPLLFVKLFVLASIFGAICCAGQQQQQQQQQFDNSFENRRVAPFSPTHCTESWQFPCDDGHHCIARYDQCDGIEQCPDGSDEKHCQPNERMALSNGHGRYDTRQQQLHEQPEESHNPLKQHHHQQQQQQQQTKSGTVENATAAGRRRDERVPLVLLLAGASAFVLVAALVHAVMRATRRRRWAARGEGGGGGAAANRRGFRKGERLVDEEDDLLIAQMYG